MYYDALRSRVRRTTAARKKRRAAQELIQGIDIYQHIAPVYAALHRDIEAAAHTVYNLPGGRGSGKSSFVALEIVNAIMLALTLFFILSITLLFRRADARQDLSLIPFDIVSQAKDNQVLFKSMVMNIVLFIPLALFGCSLFRYRSNKASVIFIVSGIGFSILIEILQYLFVLGQADVDDVICNSLGLLIGYLLYRLHDRYIMKRKGNMT